MEYTDTKWRGKECWEKPSFCSGLVMVEDDDEDEDGDPLPHLPTHSCPGAP